jgi:hypothetical protein
MGPDVRNLHPHNVPNMTSSVHRLHTFWQVHGHAPEVRRHIDALGELAAVMRTALAESGVRADALRFRPGDRGWAAALPVDADVSLVLAEAPRRGRLLLDGYNGRRVPEARLRVVAAFAMGPAAEWLSLAALPRRDAPFATVLSGTLYEQYVVPGFRFDLVPDAFQPVKVQDMTAWLHLSADGVQ